jgi:hypothetical protein
MANSKGHDTLPGLVTGIEQQGSEETREGAISDILM